MTDAELAAQIAAAAGRILIEVRENGLFEGKALGSAGDEVSNRFLLHALHAQRPDDGVLSEESRDTLLRREKSRVWIIDPVDGTREYGEKRDDWAVHVGLSIDGEAKVGAVALPGLNGGVVLRSDRVAPLPEPAATPRLVVSRTRPAKEALAVAEAIGGELIAMGSAGAKAMAVVRGQAEIYLHSGGQYQWDNCAPVAVAKAHGLHCSRIDGSPLLYNQPDTELPDLLICRTQWTERVLEEVRRIG
ncbi:3'(2'),5'-bisphosphate nucleotidase CysQ [Pelagerythrobacter aerophilus]|uniref:3'(2'),5'-bisphosphate nucleotidase CysQ n=1 Tax=Pelagerythrobacter aerophilus TaxID=2306995 RepID=A0A418NH15_9SPHN|nr:3'(2'),5'-bisphosphate nucleotidase CysQ [Pelagerythrobacter aerophilus]RIV77613.1 3'(2'),5'-bisphosphate nucleotidase CysQ [Pelagerythrobacter aerophilus]